MNALFYRSMIAYPPADVPDLPRSIDSGGVPAPAALLERPCDSEPGGAGDKAGVVGAVGEIVAEVVGGDVTEADAELEVPSLEPQLAVACDGRILMSTAGLPARALVGREVFTGVFLGAEEARFVLQRMDSAAAETASRLAGGIRQGDGKPGELGEE